MNTPSPLFLVFAFGLGACGVHAAVSLDGLAARSPFLPQQDQAAAPVVTENAAVEFRGMIATKDGVLFGLYDRTRNVGAWVRENDKSAEFQVQSYDASADLVTVDYQGRKFTLPLSTSRIATAAPSPVQAPRPPGQTGGGAPVAVNAVSADATRLESVAAEVRRRRALRQAAAAGTPAPAAANAAPAVPAPAAGQ
jgi:hypothetical protein